MARNEARRSQPVNQPLSPLQETVKKAVIDDAGRRIDEIDEKLGALREEKSKLQEDLYEQYKESGDELQHVDSEEYRLSLKKSYTINVNEKGVEDAKKSILELPDSPTKTVMKNLFEKCFSTSFKGLKRGYDNAQGATSPKEFEQFFAPAFDVQSGKPTVKLTKLKDK